jgi:hypothetical protein
MCVGNRLPDDVGIIEVAAEHSFGGIIIRKAVKRWTPEPIVECRGAWSSAVTRCDRTRSRFRGALARTDAHQERSTTKEKLCTPRSVAALRGHCYWPRITSTSWVC